MPQPLIFLLYLVFFSWLVTRVGFLRRTGIPAKWLALILIAKVAAGCLYGYIHSLQPLYASRMDTWRFHTQSLQALDSLRKDPIGFFGDLFHDQYKSGFQRFFSTKDSYWNDLKNTVMIKMVTVFNLFSGGGYYTNTIFYSFLSIFGPAALYRTFRERFPGQDMVLLFGCFFVPSLFFWGSGLHKEGLLFTALALIVHHVDRLLKGERKWLSIFFVLVSFAVVFVLRNNVIFALVPAGLAWWWAGKRGGKAWPVFIVVNLASLILFFGIPKLLPTVDPPMTMHLRQRSFIALGGRTALPVDVLKPDLGGFLHNLPSAASFSFLHPMPREGGSFYIPFTLELVALYVIALLSLVYPDRGKRGSPLLLFSINFAVWLFLIIGYCVPNVGAIIRYRSIGLPFLFLTFLLSTDWKRVRSIFQRHTN